MCTFFHLSLFFKIQPKSKKANRFKILSPRVKSFHTFYGLPHRRLFIRWWLRISDRGYRNRDMLIIKFDTDGNLIWE